jgi:putative hydrolase of the HAD superfamily
MTPLMITFDCAQTLLRVRYNPADLAAESARDVGLSFDDGEAKSVYMHLLQGGWSRYRELNLTRDPNTCSAFWEEIGIEWLRRLGLPTEKIGPIMDAGDKRLYGPDSQVFETFDDVLPCLDRLKAAGCRMAVISNWDYTLHRALRMHGLTDYFERVFASLEEGVEKPEAELFQIAANALDVKLEDIAHVGDDPIDDFQGALSAGCRAILLDRGQTQASGRIIPSLDCLEGALACC